MSKDEITSRKNPLVQRARLVRDGRDRELIFVEGVRLSEEAVHAALDFDFVLYTRAIESDERASRLLEALRQVCPRVIPVSQTVLDSASDTKTSQGIIALAKRPRNAGGVIGRGGEIPLVVILHRVNNPSNAGAVLRVAEAAGATAVISTRGSTDLFSPKALRGSMGSAFRLPVWAGAAMDEALEWCAGHGIRTVAASARADRTHTEVDWTRPSAVVFGSEGGGLTEAEAAASDEAVRIPMREPVESLNVAISLAVILYEAARQRNFC